MDDTKLKKLISEAFLPLVRGFAENHPEKVTLSLTLTKRTVQGTVTFSEEDYEALLGDTFPRDEIGAAFRALASWNDPRMPSLSLTRLSC